MGRTLPATRSACLTWFMRPLGLLSVGQELDTEHALLPWSAGFWGLLFLNSFLAYFVNLTNFLVTKHTSALTLQVWQAPLLAGPLT